MVFSDVHQDREFSWHKVKAGKNAAKHKVTFDQARAVFRDTFADHMLDDREDYGEVRWNVTGRDAQGRVLVVTYTRRDERQHIISARRASQGEQDDFEKFLFG